MSDVTPPNFQSGEHPLDVQHTPFLRFFLKIPLKKITIWAALFALLILLRDFFPLIFMTFVLSYIATSIVSRFEHNFPRREYPVLLFFGLVVTGVVGFFWLTIPRVTQEAKNLHATVKQHEGWNKWFDDQLQKGVGDDTYKSLTDMFGVVPVVSGSHVEVHDPGKEHKSLSAGLVGHISPEQRAEALHKVSAVGSALSKGMVYIFLTILFSLMLVWGLPNFKSGLNELDRSRVADIYREVAPSIAQFGRLLGRAFEAQTMIALVNTTITALGMWVLGIPGILLLSVIVFICSFIPIAGVFMSTAPIALTGLFMEGGGGGKLIGVVVMVTVAHIIEAYILNPRIYGHHMKMNPLAVLIILTIAEHTVGVWGLVIAIPLSTYVWKHVILGEAEEPYFTRRGDTRRFSLPAVAGGPGAPPAGLAPGPAPSTAAPAPSSPPASPPTAPAAAPTPPAAETPKS